MKHILFTVAAVIFVVSLAGCGHKRVAEPAVKTVETATVASAGSSSAPVFTGKAVASGYAALSFRLSGKMDAMYVREGQKVRQGDLIAALDPTDYRTQLEATKAEYDQIKGEAERVMALYAEQAVTKSKYEKALYGLQQITAKLRSHELQLSYTKLYAPISGAIGQKIAEPGEIVAAGRPVVRMVGDGACEIEINVAAADRNRMSSALAYTATINALGERSFPMKFVSVSPSANANQLFTVRLSFAGESGGVVPGMVATVMAEMLDSGSALMRVPNGAVLHQNDVTFVFKCVDGKARAAVISVVRLRPNGDYIIGSDELKAGDTIISSGVHSIKEGDSIAQLSINPGELL